MNSVRLLRYALGVSALLLVPLLVGCGGASSSAASPVATSSGPPPNPGVTDGSASTNGAEDIIYVVDASVPGNLFAFDSKPDSGDLHQISGPLSTKLGAAAGARVFLDRGANTLFVVNNDNLGHPGNAANVAIFSLANPRLPEFENAQVVSLGSIGSLREFLFDRQGLFPVALSDEQSVESLRYDAATFSLQEVPPRQVFSLPTGFLLMNRAGTLVLAVTGTSNQAAIISYQRNPLNGILNRENELDMSFHGGAGDALSPDGSLLFIADSITGAIAIVGVDSTGVLRQVTTQPANVAGFLGFLDSAHLLAVSRTPGATPASPVSSTLQVYAFDSAKATLTPGASITLSGPPTYARVSSNGHTIYVASGDPPRVNVIRYDPAAQTLAMIVTTNTGFVPTGLEIFELTQ